MSGRHATAPSEIPTLRRDAQRNYERIVAAAASVFAEQGADGSLNEVARRAGVGPATLYRRFPTRDALLAALLADRHNALAAEAEHLAEGSATADALIGWVSGFMNHVSTYRGLATLVKAGREDERSLFAATFATLIDAGAKLLKRTQQRGEIRADIDVCELLDLASGIAIAAECDPGTADRLFKLAIEGLRSSNR
jgi:AcrR family transcriptional regulator